MFGGLRCRDNLILSGELILAKLWVLSLESVAKHPAVTGSFTSGGWLSSQVTVLSYDKKSTNSLVNPKDQGVLLVHRLHTSELARCCRSSYEWTSVEAIVHFLKCLWWILFWGGKEMEKSGKTPLVEFLQRSNWQSYLVIGIDSWCLWQLSKREAWSLSTMRLRKPTLMTLWCNFGDFLARRHLSILFVSFCWWFSSQLEFQPAFARILYIQAIILMSCLEAFGAEITWFYPASWSWQSFGCFPWKALPNILQLPAVSLLAVGFHHRSRSFHMIKRAQTAWWTQKTKVCYLCTGSILQSWLDVAVHRMNEHPWRRLIISWSACGEFCFGKARKWRRVAKPHW